jgi:steroid 5-alpha reductase family enzyme
MTPGDAATRRAGLRALGVAYATALAVALAVGLALRGRSPLAVAAAADLAGTLVVFLFSLLHDNSSLYDPYWSVAPVPIATYWAWIGRGEGASGPRQLLVLGLVCAWAGRLTANQLLRWRGLAHEDFRYVELRAKAGRAYWPLSLVGVHLMPTVWVFLGLLPVEVALARPGPPLHALDLVAAAVAGAAILVEAIADGQLRRFLAARTDPDAVLEAGLWAWCRHPNYLGEVSFWWGLFLFGLAADATRAWTGAGALAITLLFLLVSVPWMDRRMARHADSSRRLRTTPGLLPVPRRWPWRG